MKREQSDVSAIKWTYHTEGRRAFILEADGTTICEIICPAQNDRVALVRAIVQDHNGAHAHGQ